MGRAHVEVLAEDGLLFSGEAEFTASQEPDSDWCARFDVETHEVAKFQMRQGEQVVVQLAADVRTRAFIGAYSWATEQPAFKGHGRIELQGDGASPVPL
jgi:hypothetical protein